MKCEKCNEGHNGIFGSGRFCSRECANSRTWTAKDNLKKSISATTSTKVKKSNKKLLGERFEKSCPICKHIFNVVKCNISKIYCTRECYLKDSTHIYRKIGLGGYREGSGRCRSGYWNNVFCASTYELAFLIWNIDKGRNIERCTQKFRYTYLGKEHLYYPDFEIDGNIYEIKGFYTDKDKAKILAVKKTGNTIKLYQIDLIKPMIDYVKNKYNISNLHNLYENYVPILKVCQYCQKEFEPKRRTKGLFCSRTCSGTYMSKGLPL